VPRLFAALGARGHEVSDASDENGGIRTMVIGPGVDEASIDFETADRVLVVGWMGTHPDARAEILKRLWTLEERARSSARPVLTLRLAPLVGPSSPLWLRLAGARRLPDGGRALLNPLVEDDAIETLDRALRGRVPWEGWYEVLGPEIWSLRELADLARRGRAPRDPGCWEPEPAVLLEQRLGESALWIERFGLAPSPLERRAREWIA
jgi:hypothetical protein